MTFSKPKRPARGAGGNDGNDNSNRENNKDISTEILDVTPDMARDWLTIHAKTNRPVSQLKVDRWAAMMVAGEWKVNGETISFDWNDKLHDGYHRLAAIVKTGVTVRMIIIKGVDPESFDTIDIGTTRTPGHMLSIKGSTYPEEEASVTRLILIYNLALAEKRLVTGNTFTTPEVIQFWQQNSLIAEAVQVARRAGTKKNHWKKIMNGSAGGTLSYYAHKNGHPPALVALFFAQLGDGYNLTEKDPIGNLRNRFINSRVGLARLQVVEALVMMIRAYNAWVEQRSLATIYGTVTRSDKELKFPAVIRYQPDKHRTAE